ncbi:MAG: discoidin domain-containing protein [Victivallales bacterium]|jgi:hypothetical protein
MIERLSFIFLCSAAAMALNFTASAETGFKASKTAAPPVIDGRLDESCWDKAPESSVFHEAGKPESKAAVATSIKILYTEDALCFGIRCDEPQTDKLIASVTKHNNAALLWGDDTVEIFLKPDTAGSGKYFHFMVNPLGTYAAEYFTSAKLPALLFNGGFQAKTFRGQNYWSVEAVIPFAGMSLGAKTNSTWAFNVARTRRAGESVELFTFAPLNAASFHTPEQFVPLSMPDLDFRQFAWDLTSPVLESILKENEIIKFITLSATVRNNSGREEKVRLETTVSGNAKFHGESEFNLKSQSECALKILSKAFLEKEGEYLIHTNLSNAVSGKLLYTSDHPLFVGFKPEITFISPGYRDCIFATQNLPEIIAEIDIASAGIRQEQLKDLKLKVTLQDCKDKNILTEKKLDVLPALRPQITFPATELAVGDYLLTAKLLDRADKTVGEASRPLRKLPPFKGEVRIDENLNVLIDGNPYFPVGFFETDPGNIPLNVNLNAAHNYCLIDHPDVPEAVTRQNLETSLSRGMKVMTLPLRSEPKEPALTQEQRLGIEKRLKRWMTNPAILGWQLADEPAGRSTPVKGLQELNDLCRQVDPFHPTLILDNNIPGIYQYCAIADILIPDCYPGFSMAGPAEDLTIVSQFVDACYDAGKRKKPAMIVLPAISWMYPEDTRRRPPTFLEERAMAYLAITHEVKGIYWFGGLNIPELRVGMPYLIDEIRALSPVFLSSTVGRTGDGQISASGGKIDYLLKKYNNDLYFFTVNTKPESASVKFKIAENIKELNVLGENRTVKIIDGQFEDSFKGYEAHVYTDSTKPVSITPLAMVYQKIEAFKKEILDNGGLALEVRGTKCKASSFWGDDVNPRHLIDGLSKSATGNYTGIEFWEPKQVPPPHWIEITLPAKSSISRVVIYPRGKGALSSYQLQVEIDGKWETITSENSGREEVLEHKFPAVPTDKVKLIINDKTPRITEIEIHEK